ncbi:MAG: ACP phosphodiesterase [Flavobacteriales bacterium]|nr:ACP phosphodiesterase [Flavobacteriales bacterium]
MGNFIGDAIKGKSYDLGYNQEILTGIQLHRFIDSYSDNHPLFIKGRKRFFSEYRHFSRVIIDVIYDHLLSVHWAEYSDEALNDFIDRNIQLLEKAKASMPLESQRFLHYATKFNVLKNYHNLEVIADVIEGIGHRINLSIDPLKSINTFRENQQKFEQEFLTFMKEIIEEKTKFINTNL